jgi:hypothetical protein
VPVTPRRYSLALAVMPWRYRPGRVALARWHPPLEGLHRYRFDIFSCVRRLLIFVTKTYFACFPNRVFPCFVRTNNENAKGNIHVTTTIQGGRNQEKQRVNGDMRRQGQGQSRRSRLLLGSLGNLRPLSPPDSGIWPIGLGHTRCYWSRYLPSRAVP